MKSQKGMGHITLIICIIVIIALICISIVYIKNNMVKQKIENLTTDMLLVQGKIKVIAQENEMNKEENTLIGKEVLENLEDEKIKKLIDNKVINTEAEDMDKYYIIDGETINNLNLENNLDGEYYIVNYKTYEIIYSKGIEIEGKMHYTLTELLEHRNTKEQNIQVINEEQINAEQN